MIFRGSSQNPNRVKISHYWWGTVYTIACPLISKISQKVMSRPEKRRLDCGSDPEYILDILRYFTTWPTSRLT